MHLFRLNGAVLFVGFNRSGSSLNKTEQNRSHLCTNRFFLDEVFFTSFSYYSSSDLLLLEFSVLIDSKKLLLVNLHI